MYYEGLHYFPILFLRFLLHGIWIAISERLEKLLRRYKYGPGNNVMKMITTFSITFPRLYFRRWQLLQKVWGSLSGLRIWFIIFWCTGFRIVPVPCVNTAIKSHKSVTLIYFDKTLYIQRVWMFVILPVRYGRISITLTSKWGNFFSICRKQEYMQFFSKADDMTKVPGCLVRTTTCEGSRKSI